MSKEATSILLDMLCLENGIIQLTDMSQEVIDLQFESLPPAERRAVHRKLRKLAKKSIGKKVLKLRSNTREMYRKNLNRTCGFLEHSDGSIQDRKSHRRSRIAMVRALLLELENCENK